jgi:guanine nucleotide-binding protein G(i) subunit alpha
VEQPLLGKKKGVCIDPTKNPTDHVSSMGATASTSSRVHPTGKVHDRDITAFLREEDAREQHVSKCLLLGAGECGKSTILRQMRILHSQGFHEQERNMYRDVVWRNMVQGAHILATALESETLVSDAPALEPDLRTLVDAIHTLSETVSPLPAAASLSRFWNHATVRRMRARRVDDLGLPDSTAHFFEHAARILVADFVPLDQDIVRARLPTTGIIETEFRMDRRSFRIFDVGGQRGERRKWIHCFQEVTAILFVASLADYNQMLVEGGATKNRLVDSMEVFEGILKLPWFRNTPIILFLNKEDVFRERVTRVDLGAYFPAYAGGLNYDHAMAFIQESFFRLNTDASKTIYIHVTNATSKNNIDFVWRATKHIILESCLKNSPLALL